MGHHLLDYHNGTERRIQGGAPHILGGSGSPALRSRYVVSSIAQGLWTSARREARPPDAARPPGSNCERDGIPPYQCPPPSWIFLQTIRGHSGIMI